MSASEAQPGAYPFSADFLKAGMDQAGAFQELFARLFDQSAALPEASMPLLAPWKEFIDGLGLGPGFMGNGTFKPEDIVANVMPALGLSREYQETGGRLLELSKHFQLRCRELTQLGVNVMQDAFHVMRKRIEADDSLLKSPSDLYDAWIECAESCYGQVARGDAFAGLLAELCNISSAMKVERGKFIEQIARHLDLPSRAEVDTLNRQVRVLTAAMQRAAAPRAASPAKKSSLAARKRRKRS
jgi:hypothetical protein